MIKPEELLTSTGLISTHELPDHFVREYADRLEIWRRDGARLGWAEIQSVKCQIWGDQTAVEVYPPLASCATWGAQLTDAQWKLMTRGADDDG